MDTACLQCQLRRHLERARSLGTEAQAMAFARDLMRLYVGAPEGVSSPWFGPHIAQLFHDHYGLPLDGYHEEKVQANRFVVERLPMLRQRVADAADPVYVGLQLAILGNYLDYSALQGQVSFGKLEQLLQEAPVLDREVYDRLCRELEAARRLLYLTDNAGEIGFDRVFAEALARRYPGLAITFCVRGGPAQNDATREDARAVGIPFPVIDNGNLVAGTQLDMLGREAREALEAADVILAKGMANAETLLGSGYPVYYAFLIKCQRFADLFCKPLFTPMLVREGPVPPG